MESWQQTDTSAIPAGGTVQNWAMSVGGVAGTVSLSALVASGGASNTILNFGQSTYGSNNISATVIGAATVRLNITTANTNITWGGIQWNERCAGQALVTLTQTAGLAIGLGTTGVKTASVEVTSAYTLGCTTASATLAFFLKMSNAAAMNATFNYKSDQVNTLPFTASAAPAASITYTLAQLGVGN